MSDTDPPEPPPQYARGCDLSQVPDAAEVAPADLKTILGVETSNPFLRAVRIERGLLDATRLPNELVNRTPLAGIDRPPVTR